MSEWKDVNKKKPCLICGKPDRCQRTADGAHRCFRLPTPPPGWRTIKVCRDGTIIARPDGGAGVVAHAPTSKPHAAPPEQAPHHDWAAENQAFIAAISTAQLDELARMLGVRRESLVAIDCGWADQADLRRLNVSGKDWHVNYPIGAFTFPEERAPDGSVVGLLCRAPDGRKGFPKGARRGLIIPSACDNLEGPTHPVEGATDVASMHTMGLNAIGRPSNNGGAEHMSVLLEGHEVLVLGENDQRLDEGGAGRWPGLDGAASVAAKLATAWGRPVRYALPPKGYKDVRAWLNAQDVDFNDSEACRALGRDLAAKLMSASTEVAPGPPALRFEVHANPKRQSSNIRVLIGERLAHLDAINLNNDKSRKRFAAQLAAKDPRLTVELVEEELLKLATEPHGPKTEDASRSRAELLAELDAKTEELLAAMPADAIAEAEAMLLNPELVNDIVADIAAMGVVGEVELSLTTYFIATSRLLDHPLAGLTQGSTSTGKSFTQQKVSQMMPSEAVIRATDLSPMALYYMPAGHLIHRFVAAGERSRNEGDELADAKKALREMLSSGELSKAIPIKIGGRMQTVVVHQYGPIAYVESTTRMQVFDEDLNRCLALGTDESSEQTRRIIEATARSVMNAPTDITSVMLRHHAIQRMLKRVQVSIPFADRLAAAMPSERPEARRAIGHTLNTIAAVALLHQRQRVPAFPQHGDVIEAQVQDYVIARRLLCGPLGRALGGSLPEAVAGLARRLRDHYGQEPFTTSEAACTDGVITSRTKIAEYLRALEGAGVVELIEKGKGSHPSTWRNKDEVPEAGARWLPTVEHIQEASPCLT